VTLSRREILKLGGAAAGLAALGGWLPRLAEIDPLQLQVIEVIHADGNEKQHLVRRVTKGPNHLLFVSPSHPLRWRPHSFFACGSKLLCPERNGINLAVFSQKDFSLIRVIAAPVGLAFYGHGINDPSNRHLGFIASANQELEDAYRGTHAGGAFLRYTFDQNGLPQIKEVYDVQGNVPHDLCLDRNQELLVHSLKFGPDGRSRIQFRDPKNLKLIHDVAIDLGERQLERRATHLHARPEGLYYSFYEQLGKKIVGGGVGFLEWNRLDAPAWEVSYTEQLKELGLNALPETLDIGFFAGQPIVAISGVGKLVRLSLDSLKYEFVGPSGLTSAVPLEKANRLIVSSHDGLGLYDQTYRLTGFAKNPSGFRQPVSHLYVMESAPA